MISSATILRIAARECKPPIVVNGEKRVDRDDMNENLILQVKPAKAARAFSAGLLYDISVP
jgi:hypothetical protein